MKLSVIVPIYGVEKYLAQALDSLRAQTVDEIEFILVDDGSKDHCPSIVDEYAAKDARFIAVHQPNGGYGKAVNHGLALAKGAYIAIFEPDDWVEPDFYARLLALANATGADIIKTGFQDFYDDGRPGGSGIAVDFEREAVCTPAQCPRMLSIHPSIWSAIYKRGFLNQNVIKMEETPGACWQDNLFQVMTYLKATKIAFVPGMGYHYRVFTCKKFPPSERIARVVEGIRAFMNAEPSATPEMFAAESIRELAYVGLGFELARPFCLIPAMKRITHDLRAVAESKLRTLDILNSRMTSRYRWAKAGVLPGLLRQVLPRVKDCFHEQLLHA